MSQLLRAHIEKITDELSADEFDHILSHFKHIKRRKHQFLVQEEELVRNEYWVEKGLLKQYFIDKTGKDHIVQFAMEDWWITDYDAYYNRTSATMFIDCIEDVEQLSISLDSRDKLCQEMHKMEHFWRVKSNFGYVALQKRILSLLKNTAQERYDRILEQYPSLIQRVPKKMLASYLGVSRETLSRM